MEKIKMSFIEVKHLKKIGEGSEAKIYKKNDKAIKVYKRYKIKKEVFENKINKIKILADLDLSRFLFPQQIVYASKNVFMGYTMDLLESNYSMYDYMKSNKYTMDQKIEMIKKLENNFKMAHNNNLVLIDGNYWNFLIYDNEVYMIDTDNYKLDKYNEDFLPPLYCDYYIDKVNGKIDNNLDKFQMGINILYYLTKEHFDENELLKYKKNKFFIENYIKSLDIPNETKDFFFELTSTNKEKKYIDNNIDNLSSNKSYIKKLY